MSTEVDVIPVSLEVVLENLSPSDRSIPKGFTYDKFPIFTNKVGCCANANSKELLALVQDLNVIPVLEEPHTVEEFAQLIVLGVTLYYPPNPEDLFLADFPLCTYFHRFSPVYVAARRGLEFLQDILAHLGVKEARALSLMETVDLLWCFYDCNLREPVTYGVEKYQVKGGKWDTPDVVENFCTKYADVISTTLIQKRSGVKDTLPAHITPCQLLTLLNANEGNVIIRPSVRLNTIQPILLQSDQAGFCFDNFYEWMEKLGHYSLPDNLLKKMERVIKRPGVVFRKIPSDRPPLPKAKEFGHYSKAAIMAILDKYTDVEIIQHYEIHCLNFMIQSNFREYAYHAVRFPPKSNDFSLKWGLRPANSGDDSFMHLTKYASAIPENIKVVHPVFLRQQVFQNNSDYDPVISYGTVDSYCSWFASELLDCISPLETDPNSFVMRVPGISGPCRRGDIRFPSEFFDRKRMIKLYRCIDARINDGSIFGNRILMQLHEKLGMILRKPGGFTEKITQELKASFQQFHPSDQQQIKRYACYLAFLPFWMRFWKGPGHPPPYQWSGGFHTKPSGSGHITSTERDLNITREKQWRDEFFHQDIDLVWHWFHTLPVSQCINGRNYVADPSIQESDQLPSPFLEKVLNKMFGGKLCIIQTSDIVSNTVRWLSDLVELSSEDVANYSRERFGQVVDIDISNFQSSPQVQIVIHYHDDIRHIFSEDLDSDEEIEGPDFDGDNLDYESEIRRLMSELLVSNVDMSFEPPFRSVPFSSSSPATPPEVSPPSSSRLLPRTNFHPRTRVPASRISHFHQHNSGIVEPVLASPASSSSSSPAPSSSHLLPRPRSIPTSDFGSLYPSISLSWNTSAPMPMLSSTRGVVVARRLFHNPQTGQTIIPRDPVPSPNPDELD